MPKEMRRGRPRGSRVQNYQKSADGKDISSNLSNQMEVIPGYNEDSETGMVELHNIRVYLNLK